MGNTGKTIIWAAGLGAAVLAGGCGETLPRQGEPAARVFDKTLTRAEVEEIVPDGISPRDSALVAQHYVRNWVTKELLLRKAEQNLSEEERDIRKQVEDYSASLLIHKYKEKLVSQKLSTEVSEGEIAAYYEEHKYNFVLRTAIARATLAIVPRSAPNLDEARRLFRSNEANDIEALEEYCITNARKYDDFGEEWVELRSVLNLLPLTEEEWEKRFKGKEIVEAEDPENVYLLKISDTRNENEIAPLEYVAEDIRLILLNKRKMSFEERLEREINEEGRQRNYVKIY